MTRLPKWILINLLCLSTLPAVADNNPSNEDIPKYLLHLGEYLGYNLKKSPTDKSPLENDEKKNGVSQTLLDLDTTQSLQNTMFGVLLGAVPVNAFSAALSQFLPNTGVPGAAVLNPLANNTFNIQQFQKQASQDKGTVTVNDALDQQTHQQDPVSQAVLNILGTPDISYCMTDNQWTGCTAQSSTGSTGEPFIPGSGITANVIGFIPSDYQYFSYQYNSQFLSQLNSNTLTAPLLYTTDSDSSGPGTGSGSGSTQNQGLTANSQAQQAANFIRYVSGSVSPIAAPDKKTYGTIYQKASANSSPITKEQIDAQITLGNYFATLRTYAAQVSVGMGNLYFIMSKRLPQTSKDQKATTSSQALSEFNMATRRLFNPDMSATEQWINKINSASSATVQKEMAILLAEINYQMYLQRQIQERLLLTNSVLLLQATHNTAPRTDFTTAPSPAGGEK